jgi:aliphatic sulfonates family ABC transporter substrate-binding protein
MIDRGRFLAAAAGAGAVLAATPLRAQDARVLRIGYQKNGLLLIAKQQGTLAKRLAPLGVSVSWVEFQSGPPLLESLNAGALDIGETGDTPPIFAQAAGANLVYVAAAPDAGRRSGILVHADGGIAKLADLKGKRIAFTKGSSAHNVLLHALAAGGVAYADIQPVYLQPADAAAAFRNGGVDAWSVWDPFFALGQQYPNTRTLVTAEKISPSNRFYLGGTAYVAHNADIVAAFVEELGRGGRWATTHPAELAQVVAQTTGVDPDTAKIVAGRDIYGVSYITDAILKQQQAIADAFAQLGLIPQRVDVRAIAYEPNAKAKAALAQIEGSTS